MKRNTRSMFLTIGAFAAAVLMIAPAAFSCPIETLVWCEYELVAGQDYDAGRVEIYNKQQGSNYWLEVYIIAEDGWMIDESHVDVQFTADAIPQTKKGNPKIGKFAYSDPDSETSTQHMYKISDFGALDGCQDQVAIAVHAVVYRECGEDAQWETAWGNGEDFEGKNWAMYILFPCCKYPEYPDDVLLKMDFKHWGAESYWDATIMTDGSYDLSDWANIAAETYVVWCFDEHHTMSAGTNWAYLQDPYDYDDDLPWDKINWIINHRDDYTKEEVQNAIWHYADGKSVSGNAAQLVSDADEFGPGFKPSVGQMWAIVILTDQINIIELDP